MYRPVPVFGRLASLMGFAMGDPHAFISEAVSSARSARVNSFEMYLGGTRMAVVFEQEHARQVLALPRKLARFYKPEMMVEWMGRYSPLTVDDPAEQERARTLCLKMMPVLTEDPLIETIKHALALIRLAHRDAEAARAAASWPTDPDDPADDAAGILE